MEEQILKIINTNLLTHARITDALEDSTKVITFHVMEFIEWIADYRYPFIRRNDYWIRADTGNVQYTTSEVYQYWLIHVKNKE